MQIGQSQNEEDFNQKTLAATDGCSYLLKLPACPWCWGHSLLVLVTLCLPNLDSPVINYLNDCRSAEALVGPRGPGLNVGLASTTQTQHPFHHTHMTILMYIFLSSLDHVRASYDPSRCLISIPSPAVLHVTRPL